MKSWYHFSLLGLLGILLSSCATEKDRSEIAEQLDDSLALISYPDQGGHGTGFFVPGDAEQCKILTARHVVTNQEVVKVKTKKDQQTREVKQILLFKNQDLALLTFPAEAKKCPYPALKFGDSNTVKRLHSLYISGFYSNGGRIFNHVVPGVVTAIDSLPEGYGIAYQSSTYQGMSGSPVLNTRGKVVAVHGRSDVEITRLAEIEGFAKPQLQALDEEEAIARGVRIGTFKWGIPINLYLANIPATDAIAIIPETEAAETLSAKDYYDQGRELRDSGKHEEALQAFIKATEIDPDYVFAWVSKGISLADLERYEEAIASYDKALELNPDYAIAWYNRGITLNDLERYEEAIASYDKALELDPDYVDTWVNRGYSFELLKRYEEALTSHNKAIEINPNDALAWYNKGVQLGNLERYEEAIASYDKSLELDPDYVDTWNNRGSSLHYLEKYEEAIASYDKSLELDPDYVDTWNNRGSSLHYLEKYEEAIASYDKAIELDPDYANAINNRKLALEKIN